MKSMKKIFDILTFKEKKNFFLLVLFFFFTAVLDMAGVASIFPFISILTNPQILENNIILQDVYKVFIFFELEKKIPFLFFLGTLVLLLLTISICFRAISTYASIRFALMLEYSISKRLVQGYLNQPYSWFLNRNSSDLGKTVLSEVNQVTTLAISPVINIIVQSLISMGLLAVLILINPLLALNVTLFFFIFYALLFYFIKNILSRLGQKRLKANADRFLAVNEAFGANKEIKAMGLEKFYISSFSKPAKIYARTLSLSSLIGALPRYCIEGFAFGGMIILILIFISQEKTLSSIIPIISIYAFSGYRMIPALQQVYTSLTKIRFSKPIVDNVCNDLKILNQYDKSLNENLKISIKEFIKLENIDFYYLNNKFSSIRNISLTIPIKSKVGIVGSTGSGKTTLVDIILGILEPSKGRLTADQIKISQNLRAWQKIIGYVPQNVYLSDSSVAQNIAFGVEPKNIDQNKLESAAKTANIHQFIINNLPNKYSTIIGERGVRISGGQRQRIAIARALYRNPEILILDEASSSLDNATEKIVMEAIDNLKDHLTIIIIAHRLSTVKNCDNIFVLKNGTIEAQGTYNELQKLNLLD
jgi:ABC-type bacteriocin/lantibiotic exporter with double-glycine peptidase domain